MNDGSSVLIDTMGIKEVKLPAERKASGPVFRDEIVEDPIAFAFIEALIAQHRYDHVCQRRSKNRPRGGAKVGHCGAHETPGRA